jgi:hypothetical protein
MSLRLEIIKFKDEVNQHRRRVRRFEPESVVVACSEAFRWAGMNIDRLRVFPHDKLYQLLKIAIKETERPYATSNEVLDKDFRKLMEVQKNLHGPQLTIARAEGDPAEMVLKWLFQFCQKPYQDTIDATAIGRSVFLYQEEICRLDIQAVFLAETGVPLRSFFQGCFGEFTIASENLFVKDAISGSTLAVFTPSVWRNFQRLVRVDFAAFRRLCAKFDLESHLYEMFSAPVLLRAPILLLPSGRNIVPWPKFLLHRLCFGPYDILKDSLGSKFTDAFGTAFQNYVARILELLRVRVQQDYSHDKDATGPGKTPDFFIVDETAGTLLCIEAKANEDVLVIKKTTLLNTARPILGKAVCQCYDLWQRARQGQEQRIPKDLPACIPLIVTLRSFFFANREFYRNNVVLSERNGRDERTFKMCVDNYQVLDIESFENLAKICLATNRSFLQIVQEKIRSAKEDDWSSFLNDKINEAEAAGVWNNHLHGITEKCEALFDELEKSLTSNSG